MTTWARALATGYILVALFILLFIGTLSLAAAMVLRGCGPFMVWWGGAI